MSWINRVAAVLVLGLALCAGPALAEGDFNFVGRFVNADTEVDVATFALVNDQGVEERIILLGVINQLFAQRDPGPGQSVATGARRPIHGLAAGRRIGRDRYGRRRSPEGQRRSRGPVCH